MSAVDVSNGATLEMSALEPHVSSGATLDESAVDSRTPVEMSAMELLVICQQ